MVDPRELTAGYVFAQRNLGTAYGVLRDGRTVVWKCSTDLHHRPHSIPSQAMQCAERELERRLQGAKEVLWTLRCEPCQVYWDDAAASKLLRGLCPACGVPGTRTRIAVLERQERSAR